MILNVKDTLVASLQDRLNGLDPKAASRLANLARKSKKIIIESRGLSADVEANLDMRICVVSEDGATPSFTNDQNYVGGILRAGDKMILVETDPAKILILGNSSVDDDLRFIYVTA